MNLADKEFQIQFEGLSLPESQFDHIGHLRMAFIYLQQNDLADAIEKTCSGIDQYATSLGAADKFNHTLTEATVRIMASRIGSEHCDNFADFKIRNPDIVKNLKGVLLQHYAHRTLFGEQAKRQFVQPDKKSLQF